MDDYTTIGTSSGSAGTSSGAFIVTGSKRESFSTGKVGLTSSPHVHYRDTLGSDKRSRNIDIVEEKNEDPSPTSKYMTKNTLDPAPFPTPVPPPPASVSQTVRICVPGLFSGSNGSRWKFGKKRSLWEGGQKENPQDVALQTRTTPSTPLSTIVGPGSPVAISPTGLVATATSTTQPLMVALQSTNQFHTPDPSCSIPPLSTSGNDPNLSSLGRQGLQELVSAEKEFSEDEDDFGINEDCEGVSASGRRSHPHSRPRSRLSSSSSRHLGPFGAAEKVLGIGVSMRPSSPCPSLSLPTSQIYLPTPISSPPSPRALTTGNRDGLRVSPLPSLPPGSSSNPESKLNHSVSMPNSSSSFRTLATHDSRGGGLQRSITPPPSSGMSQHVAAVTLESATE